MKLLIPFQECSFSCRTGRILWCLYHQSPFIYTTWSFAQKIPSSFGLCPQKTIDLLTFCSSDLHPFEASDQLSMALSDIDGMNHLNIELRLDTDTDHFPLFSTISACPSLASTFPSYGVSSPIEVGGDRRPSIPSSEASMLLSSQGTSIRNSHSPMTPLSPDMMEMVMASGAPMGCTSTESGMHGMFQYNDPAFEEGGFHWPVPEFKQRLSGHSSAFNTPQHYSIRQPHHEVFLSSDQSLVAGAALESSLSRTIFHHRQPSDSLVAEHMTQWRPSVLQTPPRTVAPSATFQPIVPSSPLYRVAPSTPIHNKYEDSVTSGVASIPYSSSPIYPSSEGTGLVEDEFTCHNIQPILVRTLRGSKCKGSSRSSRKSAEKKDGARTGRLSKTGTSRLGLEYPYYIEKNSFACTAEDCVDKNGKRKKFKRQEHLKRHQRTCHTGNRPHYCWVPGCTTKPFSRTDNLNSHLLKTHGKNSPAARNRYIATLDPKSGVYDVDYRGPFTESGWPIRSK